MTRPVALIVAGTDSGGGAGVLADAKTFWAHGVWSTVAVTAVTAQNPGGVRGVASIDAGMVRSQIDAVLSATRVDAVKTGMLATVGIVEAVAAAIGELGLARVVVDPVLVATSGAHLLDRDARSALARKLIPQADLVTPNLEEAKALVEAAGGPTVAIRDRAGMEAAGRAILDLGVGAVLVKGGHLPSQKASPDCLLLAGAGEVVWLDGPRLPEAQTHGTGCVLSAAIAAELALGRPLVEACRRAKAFVTGAIGRATGLGVGP